MRIGDVVQKIALARFSRTLSSLVTAGVDIVKALEITAGHRRQLGDRALASNDVRVRVQEGVPISEPLAADPAFPPMVSQMVKIGEETGELDKMLGKIADFYEDEVDTSIQSLTSIIEPIMMIGVGAHGRHDRDLDVPADVQDAPARQVSDRLPGRSPRVRPRDAGVAADRPCGRDRSAARRCSRSRSSTSPTATPSALSSFARGDWLPGELIAPGSLRVVGVVDPTAGGRLPLLLVERAEGPAGSA